VRAMLASTDRSPLPSRVLQERYGEGYFRGENSGFAAEGYDRVHATWKYLMPFVRAEVGEGARWLDLGCAYGFLVDEARAAGFRAEGLDASHFAVAQARRHAPAVAERLVAGHAERLPFAAARFDVVTAFDLLEHVPDPEAVIREAARVLRAGGLFLAATPDPLCFDREEPTHVAERVPSFWIEALGRAGLAARVRFFQAPYNCELVARKGPVAPAISFDALGREDPVLRADGRLLHAAFRSGIGQLEADGTRVVDDGARVYLLNRSGGPLALALEAELVEPAGTVTFRLNGRVIGRFPAATRIAVPPVLVAEGGNQLRIGIEAGWAKLRTLAIAGEPAERAELCATLPFDLHERYALAAAVVASAAPAAARLLDVGGAMGADSGHLAWAGDFFAALDVTVVDARPVDHPRHLVAPLGESLPFRDRSFEVVCSQDVLEHVPAASREAWLEELWRVTDRLLLLGNPFATPGAAEADRYLFELIRTRWGYEHRFLLEHLEHGLPDLDATRAFFAGKGASVAVLPSGHLPTWLLLQTVNALLSHPEQDLSFVHANRAANRALGVGAAALPAYRHLLVVDRTGERHDARLAHLAAPPPDSAALHGLLPELASVSVR
jgi:2-polyprenyl-3-methyl-5-hydroxy-6-metoxy-1,4-benzoquinol methylase